VSDTAPAGWYEVPHSPENEAWWDGSAWHPTTIRPKGAAEAPGHPVTVLENPVEEVVQPYPVQPELIQPRVLQQGWPQEEQVAKPRPEVVMGREDVVQLLDALGQAEARLKELRQRLAGLLDDGDSPGRT